MKVILAGPPQSGKSCLREGLKTMLMALNRQGKCPYPYFLTACPDGEGAWYSETYRNNPDLARQLKEEYKAKFTWEFAQRMAEKVDKTNEPLTLVDIGGKIDEKNRLIVKSASHAVIIAGDISRISEWEGFCNDLDIKVLAILHSDYNGDRDIIETETPILRGRIHHLERGEKVSERPMVQALGRLLAGRYQEK